MHWRNLPLCYFGGLFLSSFGWRISQIVCVRLLLNLYSSGVVPQLFLCFAVRWRMLQFMWRSPWSLSKERVGDDKPRFDRPGSLVINIVLDCFMMVSYELILFKLGSEISTDWTLFPFSSLHFVKWLKSLRYMLLWHSVQKRRFRPKDKRWRRRRMQHSWITWSQ